MSSTITADASAGLPLEVTLTYKSPDGTRTRTITHIVAAGKVQNFFVSRDRDVSVREIQPNEDISSEQ